MAGNKKEDALMSDGEVTLNSIQQLIKSNAAQEKEHHQTVVSRLDKINGRIDRHDGRLDGLERTDAVLAEREKSREKTLKMLGAMVVGAVAVFGTIISVILAFVK